MALTQDFTYIGIISNLAREKRKTLAIFSECDLSRDWRKVSG